MRDYSRAAAKVSFCLAQFLLLSSFAGFDTHIMRATWYTLGKILLVVALCSSAACVSAQNSFTCLFASSSEGQSAISAAREDGKKVAGKVEWSSQDITAAIKTLKKKQKSFKKKGALKKLKKAKKQVRELQLLGKFIGGCVPPNSTTLCVTPPNAKGFDSVRCILQNRCFGCHATQGTWENTQEFYLSTAKIEPSNPAKSALYTFLKGNPEGYGPGLMPKNLPGIPLEEIAAIKEWILGIPIDIARPEFKFTCDPARDPSVSPLMRLSRQQYVNSLYELANLMGGGSRSSLLNVLWSYQGQVPQDRAQQNFLSEQAFTNLDQRILTEHNDAYFRIATVFADTVTATASLRQELSGGNCDPSASGAGLTCLRNFLNRFLLRAFRRPPNSDELARYEAFFISRPLASAMHDVVVRALSSPQFLYQLEVEGTPVNGRSDLFTLSAYELVSRLYLHFWQRMPDAYGFSVAVNNATATPEGLAALVEYLFNTLPEDNVKATIETFYDESLGIYKIEGINVGETAAFSAFASPLSIDRNAGYMLVDDMITETHDFMSYYTWQTPGTFGELLTSDLSFAKGNTLASIYNSSPWQTGTAPARLPSGQPRGLLGRAVLLITGGHETNPAKRGARAAREIMCNDLPDPDSTIMNMAVVPEFNPTLTTRERFEAKTAAPACVGCHGTINGFGFALESFDAIGRIRTQEKMFDEDGVLLGQKPINTAVELVGLGPVRDAVELNQKISNSGRAHGCFAQKYFRFSFRRREDFNSDGCVLEALRAELKNPAGIKNMLKKLALLPEFRLRKKAP